MRAPPSAPLNRATLPQLIEEDIRQLNQTLSEFMASADASAALLIDKGGFLITHRGDENEFDFTTIAALAAGAFLANQTIAALVKETGFDSMYQQGKQFSLFVVDVDEQALMVVIFKSQAGVGIMKYFAAGAIQNMARQLMKARERAPSDGLDLSMLNVADASPFFHKKKATPR